MSDLAPIIAKELNVKPTQVLAAIKLLDEGATVPFIARYRKEATNGLDDTELRHLQERLIYLRELNERRETILNSIESQGKLTEALKSSILVADNKTTLEDLYLPYKPKRRTKGQIAKERGLEPLAEQLLDNSNLDPITCAEKFINPENEINTAQDALEGARYILMEKFADNANIVGACRDLLHSQGRIISATLKDKETEKDAQKFKDYFDHQEPIKSVPSHRMLAMLRGRNEGFLKLSVVLPEEKQDQPLGIIANHLNFKPSDTPRDIWLQEVIKWTWRIKLHTHLELDLISQTRELAEEEAIKVFSLNLKDLLMAPPAGNRATMGVDPGLRTGTKIAVVDKTGKLLDTATIYPLPPHNKLQQSIQTIAALCEKHHVDLISIGNGTASRETERFVEEVIKLNPKLNLTKIVVSEAGASVYSASELAAKEFPDVDVSLRGAISIARRLQDPLAELVKIEPKSIGVGQYQHDVNQAKLSRTLNNVIEDCVSSVGVNVNTASAPLLTQIAGLNKSIADNIVTYREANGSFKTRENLLSVPRLGAKAFEQAAGFLRIINGDNPLDASSVHPEAYPVVERILAKQKKAMTDIIGNKTLLKSLSAHDYIDEQFGEPTVNDIIKELEKPGLDPRPEFKTAQFKEGIEKISDLKPGMILEGVVTNVANFGAFVDIGVHQDGLVHISVLSENFVKDPRDVVKTGQIVKVKVMEIELDRKRISLSMRLNDDITATAKKTERGTHKNDPRSEKRHPNKPKGQSFQGNTTLADAFNKAFAKE